MRFITLIKLILIIIFLLVVIRFVSASCEPNSIDINTASKEDLEKLDGIGPVKAGEIIKARPFNSVDDLITAWGIGDVTLEKIKIQGCACVNCSETKEHTQNTTISSYI